MSAPTANPDATWVTQQARNASMQMAEWNLTATHLIIDHGTKFAGSFDTVFEAQGTQIIRVGPEVPNMNPHAERWVRSLRQECLDHFIVVGERHLHHLVTSYVEHYNSERPHQGLGNVPLPDAAGDEPRVLKFPSGEVKCKTRLGGLLKHYRPAA